MSKIKNTKIKSAIYLSSIVIIIIGLAYASVPLYQLFCQATGFGGTVQKTADPIFKENNEKDVSKIEQKGYEEKDRKIAREKIVTVYFNADVNERLPWTFKPTINKIQILPGDPALTFYIAKNNSEEAITGISTYHVTPAKVGIYFNKIQCFCFEEQRLKGNETIEMPVLFFLDSDFKEDPKMQDVESITLSYTFYKSL